MNRFLKYSRAKRRKCAAQPIRGISETCSFCGGKLVLSPLIAASKLSNASGTGPLAAICADCVERLAPLCKLMRLYQRFYRDDPDIWTPLASAIGRRIGGEPGDPPARTATTELLAWLAKRSCSILHGYKTNGAGHCPRTGVALAAPRIGLVCLDPPVLTNLLTVGADAVGIPVQCASQVEAELGDAYRALREKCNHDCLIAAAAGLLLLDGHAEIQQEVAVFYVVRSNAHLPTGIETLKLPG
jgi:hypothetical protein